MSLRQVSVPQRQSGRDVSGGLVVGRCATRAQEMPLIHGGVLGSSVGHVRVHHQPPKYVILSAYLQSGCRCTVQNRANACGDELGSAAVLVDLI